MRRATNGSSSCSVARSRTGRVPSAWPATSPPRRVSAPGSRPCVRRPRRASAGPPPAAPAPRRSSRSLSSPCSAMCSMPSSSADRHPVVIIATRAAVVDFWPVGGRSVARQTTDPATLTTLSWSKRCDRRATGAALVVLGGAARSRLPTASWPDYLPWIAAGLSVRRPRPSSLGPDLQRQLALPSAGDDRGGLGSSAGIVTIVAAVAGAGESFPWPFGHLWSGPAIELVLLLARSAKNGGPRLLSTVAGRGHASFAPDLHREQIIASSGPIDYVMIGYFPLPGRRWPLHLGLRDDCEA